MAMAKKEEVSVKFPYGIPADTDVKQSIEIGRLVNITNEEKETRDYNKIFCELCSFPMKVCVHQKPCNHNVCYTCFERSPNDCKV